MGHHAPFYYTDNAESTVKRVQVSKRFVNEMKIHCIIIMNHDL